MLPISSGGHSAYQDTFVSNFLAYYPDPFVLSKNTWDTIIHFWHLDLSSTDTLMQDLYSKYGPEPRLPSCMLRSYLLSIKLKITSITVWAAMLKECPLYAILSGFPVNNTPGVGTFYDFFNRLWQSDNNNFSPHKRFPKKKVKKGKKHGAKTPADSTSIASKLIPFFERHPLKPNNPFSLVFKLYHQQFLNVSIKNGLIAPKHLAVAGDGTPIRTSARERKKRIVIAKKKGFITATVKDISFNLIVIGAGTLHVTAIFMAITCTCLFLQILIVICLFFPYLNVLLATICFPFCIPSFLCNPTYLNSNSKNYY